MIYSTIDEAWGGNSNNIGAGNNNMSSKYTEYMRDHFPNEKKQPVSEDCPTNHKFNPISNNEVFSNVKLELNHANNFNKCDDFLNHVSDCKVCRNKLINAYRPKLLEGFQDVFNTHRDTVVLILAAIFIMLFFNLVINVSKK